MAIYPGAHARLIPKHNTRKASAHHRVTLHQAVTNATSLHGFFADASACSHFYVAENGTVEQYIDTNNRSGADLDGNDASISIETWDKANTVGEWTPAQVSAIAALIKWIVATHPSIPLRLAQDSRLGESSKGIAPHRLGVDSYPAGKPGWRVAGAMRYSSARGKTCPGDGRIAQLPAIVVLAAGATAVSNQLAAKTSGVRADDAAALAALTPISIDRFKEYEMNDVVATLYRKLVGREAGVPEIDNWVMAAIERDMSPKALRDSISAAGAESGTVVLAYAEFLKRVPSASEIAGWTKPGMTIGAVRNGIAASPEAKARK